MPYYILIYTKINNQITAPELRVIDEHGANLGILPRDKALTLAREQGLDLVEIAATANPPVAKIISFDKFRYQKEKEEKKLYVAQKKIGELKQIRISPRAAKNDLEIKIKKIGEFLSEGHKIEISIFLRGREKANRDWALQKLNNFLTMIKVPHVVTLSPRPGGRGFVSQIAKK
ncbi:MAG: translation initiation factor IF-3 [Candidatus Jorgensenbacteria bacterium]|nr:translation initiation factor IF-3 [Candidatus Jorgensenbacteria bacterium]